MSSRLKLLMLQGRSKGGGSDRGEEKLFGRPLPRLLRTADRAADHPYSPPGEGRPVASPDFFWGGRKTSIEAVYRPGRDSRRRMWSQSESVLSLPGRQDAQGFSYPWRMPILRAVPSRNSGAFWRRRCSRRPCCCRQSWQPARRRSCRSPETDSTGRWIRKPNCKRPSARSWL